MAKLQDILAYMLQRYPHSGDLSNARVTKMVYLADWRHVLEEGRQISSIRWYFDNYGPFVWDVLDTVNSNPFVFRAKETINAYGSHKTAISCIDASYAPQLDPSERHAIDHVIQATAPLGWQQFIGLVYSTHPIVRSERFTHLDLRKLATEYKKTPVYRSVSPA